MTAKDVLDYYRTGYNFNKMTGMSINTFRNWMIKGAVPKNAQYRLEAITKGELKV